ncbi:MAG TPA: 2,5-diamino-6-(ribosylamino)-4(3H)-pyrimidinone 5'-phosphate reductase [Nitrosopumilaceae archaeon]|nr:2,5-diamino-6-(ribosylamino)-4(3H)-pyrimidinone 5'-phosphate reductase [Nitrosopumilaceae archaeon]
MEKFRPRVILSAAMSVDGKIATKTGDSELSSIQDKIRIHKLRSKVDAIMIGSNTVMRDNPLLNVRYVKGKNPIRIILDSKATIDEKSQIIRTCNKIPTIIVISEKASKLNISKLEKYPLEIMISGKNQVNIKSLLKSLSRKKIQTILVEGGGTVNWEFLRLGLVDEIILTITPYIIGGKNAITLVEGQGYSKIRNSPKLKLKKIYRLKNEIILYYN